jgi:membrane protein DedA with SNARE-associated domain
MSAVLVPLAHHALLIALPFVVPVLVLTLGVAALAFRERRRREREDV